MPIPSFIWLRQEEIVEIAKKRTLTSDELLSLKSVSFYAPIKLLNLAKGEHEENKEAEVRCTYNILRYLDELEDELLTNFKDKNWAIDRYAYQIGEVVRREEGADIEDIINCDDLKSVTRMLVESKGYLYTRIFAEHFGRGDVLRDFYKFDPKIKRAIDYGVKGMADGMNRFLERGGIKTIEQLKDYCYHVAGRIGGEVLNSIVEIKDKYLDDKLIEMPKNSAEKLGMLLQFINIIKNTRSDWEEGRIFIPDEICPKDITYQEIMEGKGIGAENARKEVLETMIALAEENIPDAISYIKIIPEHLTGYKNFCMVPFTTAIETLKLIKRSETEKVFGGDINSIKIPNQEFRNIMDFSYDIIKSKEAKYNEWLDKYRDNASDFSFANADYSEWSGNWLA